jgi:hypothetical protein
MNLAWTQDDTTTHRVPSRKLERVVLHKAHDLEEESARRMICIEISTAIAFIRVKIGITSDRPTTLGFRPSQCLTLYRFISSPELLA